MSVKRTAAKKVSRPADKPATLDASCVIEGCNNPVLHRGLCAEHWEDPTR